MLLPGWFLSPPSVQARLQTAVDAAVSFRPHVLVTIDSKGFSYRLHRAVRKAYSIEAGRAAAQVAAAAPVAPAKAAAAGGTTAQSAGAGAVLPDAISAAGVEWDIQSDSTTSTVSHMSHSQRYNEEQEQSKGEQRPITPISVQYVAPSFWAWKGGEASLKVM